MTTVVLVVVLLVFAVAPYFLQSKVASESSFVVGDRDQNWFGLTAGLSATFVGGAALLNIPSVAYSYGWYAMSDIGPATLALILSGFFLVPFVRKSKEALSLGTYLNESGKIISGVSGLLSTVVYTLISAAQILAVTTLLSPYFSIPGWALSLVVSLAVAAYILVKGYHAVTLTDRMQYLLILFGFMVFGVVAVFLFGFEAERFSGSAVEPTPMPFDMMVLLAIPLLFIPSSQDVHVRIHSAKNNWSALLGCILAGVSYLAIGIVSILIGVTAAKQGLQVDSPDQVTMAFFEAQLGAWAVIPVVAILAAIVSSLDSVLFAATASLSFDVPFWKKDGDTNNAGIPTAVSMATILVAALTIALFAPRILSIILSALLVYVVVLLPLLFGIWLRVKQEIVGGIALFFLAATVIYEIVGPPFSYRGFVFAFAHVVLLVIAAIMFDHQSRAEEDAVNPTE